jgi:hypothetical protein
MAAKPSMAVAMSVHPAGDRRSPMRKWAQAEAVTGAR